MAGEQAKAVETVTPAGEEGSQQEQQSGNVEGSDTGAGQEGSQVEGEGGESSEGEDGAENNGAAAAEKPGKKKDPWWQHRINELTRKNKEAEEQRNREVTALNARLAALESGGNGGEANNSSSGLTAEEAERRIQEGVDARFRQQSFNDTCNAIYSEGDAKYTGKDDEITFREALAQLGMVGEIPAHFIEAATAFENGHDVLYHLGANPDTAAELLSLPPVKLAIRMSDIARDMKKPATKPVSRTAAPIKPVSGTARADIDLRTASLDDFMAARDRAAPVKR